MLTTETTWKKMNVNKVQSHLEKHKNKSEKKKPGTSKADEAKKFSGKTEEQMKSQHSSVKHKSNIK